MRIPAVIVFSLIAVLFPLVGEKKGCQEDQEGSEVILPRTLAVPCIKCICEVGQDMVLLIEFQK